MKVLLYPFFLQSALRGSASVPLHASRTNILTHAHHRSALLLRFSPKNVFFFLLLLFFFSFTLVPADVLSTSNYFCLQKNRDWRVLWAAAVRFTGWENAPKKHNKRELAQHKRGVEFSHRILLDFQQLDSLCRYDDKHFPQKMSGTKWLHHLQIWTRVAAPKASDCSFSR